MKKILNIYYLFLSSVITFLLTYILPCQQIDELRKTFGFPFGWFTIFDDTIGNVILSSTAVNLPHFLANIAIWYFMILLVHKTFRRIRARKNL